MRETARLDTVPALGHLWTETSAGHWVFRNRSWLPIPLGIAAVFFTPAVVDWRLVYAGALCIVAGEALRLWAVRHIGVVSRTRTTRLGPLVTSGPYAHTRNPLYIGNWLLWTGFALGSSLRWLVPVSWAVFAVQHAFVVQWEEQLLAQRYPASYGRYAGVVARWFPRLSGIGIRVPYRRPYPWIDVMFSERGTLMAIALAAMLILVRRIM
ncbi:MAG TPA: methyltransferase [Vicinamibacterales bacterium]